jgi:hypothetical protein
MTDSSRGARIWTEEFASMDRGLRMESKGYVYGFFGFETTKKIKFFFY